MRNTLEIDGVYLEFDQQVILQNVYLKSSTQKITGLLGRNGTGKSSLMNIIYGNIIPLNGSVRINGKTIIGKNRSPQLMRYLPQSNFIPKNFKVHDVFNDFKLDYSRFESLFPEIKNYSNSSIHQLSSGLIRVMEVYIVICATTKICLLDEPFSQISPKNIEQLKVIIKQESNHKAIVLTDHLYQHVVTLSDELYLIKNGSVHLCQNTNDLEQLGYTNNKTSKE